VLGTPRSGTNAVAGVMHRLGIMMGERFIADDPEWNARGFYQDADFHEAHATLFSGDEFPRLGSIVDYADVDPIRGLVRRRVEAGSDFGFAGMYVPWLSPNVVEWCRPMAVAVIVVRRPFHESVQSWAARTGTPLEIVCHGMARALYAVEEAAAIVGCCKLELSYHELLRDRESTVKRIAEFVGRDSNRAAIDFIDPSLRRFGSPL
jgi:hypothetical protein